MKRSHLRKLNTAAMLIALTICSCFMTAHFTAQNVQAQSVSNGGDGPQDGGDGKKKPVRPPTRPTLTAQTPDQSTASQDAITADSATTETDWLQEIYNWIFG